MSRPSRPTSSGITPPTSVSAADICRQIEDHGGPMTARAQDADGRVNYSAQALVSWRTDEEPVWYRGVLRGFSECMSTPALGEISVDDETLEVHDDRSNGGRWCYLELAAVQATSSSLQLSLPGDRLVQFRFLNDSPRRWEDLLHRLVSDAYERAGRGRVIEFQPRIVTALKLAGTGELERGLKSVSRAGGVTGGGGQTDEGQTGNDQAGRNVTGTRVPSERVSGAPASLTPMPMVPNASKARPTSRQHTSGSRWYAWVKVLALTMAHTFTRLRVSGRENIPKRGPFFLIANHEGVLDPILVQSVCPRPIHTLTKSTQFRAGRFFRWLLPRINAIPTRRYRVDPQVVRTALRTLEKGEAVGIYPEGERSWDGQLQPFRRGAIRLLLKPGVPVVPCGIKGSFGAWPRWARRPYRCEVSVCFGKPLLFGVHNSRADRDAALEAASDQIAKAFIRLTADPPTPSSISDAQRAKNPNNSSSSTNPVDLTQVAS